MLQIIWNFYIFFLLVSSNQSHKQQRSKRAINIMTHSSIGLKRHAAATAIQARVRGYFVREKRYAAATAIQARMRGCFARDQVESDVHREITHKHRWNPQVPSERLLVLRANDRRMMRWRDEIRRSMPITYAVAQAAKKRWLLRRLLMWTMLYGRVLIRKIP